MTSHPSPSTFLSVNLSADSGAGPDHGGSWSALVLQLSARAIVSPRLAIDLLRTAWAFRRREWWTRAPFLIGWAGVVCAGRGVADLLSTKDANSAGTNHDQEPAS